MDILASLTPIFKPKSVAVIGASTAPGKLGHDILANLKNGGFPGPLYPINPKADEILGLKAYKAIGDTPVAPELAVVVIPAKIVAPTLEQCAEKGVKAAGDDNGGLNAFLGALLQSRGDNFGRNHHHRQLRGRRGLGDALIDFEA